MAKKHRGKSAQDSFKEEKDPLSRFIKLSHNWVVKYFTLALLTMAVAILAFGLMIFYSYWQKQQNKKAQEFLWKARAELISAEQKAGGEVLGFDTNAGFFGQPKKAQYSPDLKQKAQRYISEIKKHISKPAGLSAVMEMAHFLREYDQDKSALQLLQSASAYKRKNPVGFLLAFQHGVFLMDQNACEEAVQSFRFITESAQAKWLWPEALINTALCHEKQKQLNQARAVYKKIKNIFPDSQAGEKAVRYKNAMVLLQKMQSLKAGTATPSANDGGTKPASGSAKPAGGTESAGGTKPAGGTESAGGTEQPASEDTEPAKRGE